MIRPRYFFHPFVAFLCTALACVALLSVHSGIDAWAAAAMAAGAWNAACFAWDFRETVRHGRDVVSSSETSALFRILHARLPSQWQAGASHYAAESALCALALPVLFSYAAPFEVHPMQAAAVLLAVTGAFHAACARSNCRFGGPADQGRPRTSAPPY